MTLVDTSKIGRKGGKNSRKNLPDGGTALGQAAAKARWEAYYAAHPDKLKARREREKQRTTSSPKKKAPAK
jgi:hypothetical protein